MTPRARDEGLTRFVLLSTQRSGTSWLMERLVAHPHIGGYGELLLANRRGRPDWPPGAGDRPFYDTYLHERGAAGSRWYAHRHLFAFLDYVYTPRRDFRAIGFKLMYDEATKFPELLAYFHHHRVRVLHLLRVNLLDIALSQIAASVRHRVHAWSGAEREELAVQVDLRYLRKLLRRLEYQRNIASLTLGALRVPVHVVTYEDLLEGDAALPQTFRFLDVSESPDVDLTAKMLKLAPVSHRAGIANFDDVVRCLHGTRYQPFLRPT